MELNSLVELSPLETVQFFYWGFLEEMWKTK